MSKVYSFRLDENNPREAQAREVISAWVSKGYSIRYILTEALIRFGENEYCSKEMAELLEQLQDIVCQSQKDLPESKEDVEASSLQANFLEAVKKAAKLGLQSRVENL